MRLCLFCIQALYNSDRLTERCIFLSDDLDFEGSRDIDLYTGGLAELPVPGGLVRFLFHLLRSTKPHFLDTVSLSVSATNPNFSLATITCQT